MRIEFFAYLLNKGQSFIRVAATTCRWGLDVLIVAIFFSGGILLGSYYTDWRWVITIISGTIGTVLAMLWRWSKDNNLRMDFAMRLAKIEKQNQQRLTIDKIAEAEHHLRLALTYVRLKGIREANLCVDIAARYFSSSGVSQGGFNKMREDFNTALNAPPTKHDEWVNVQVLLKRITSHVVDIKIELGEKLNDE